MTRVVVIPSDETACGLYRMRLPAGAVRSVRPQWSIEVYRPSDVQVGTGPQGELWNIQGIPEVENIDLLVMQRVATRAQVEMVKWIRSKGAAVVIDVDDAMWCIDEENSAWAWWNRPEKRWKHLDAATESADLVTVTTPALARRYARHGREEVLPNCVPADLPGSVRESLDPRPTLGWAGFTATHPRDLQEVGDAVARVQAETNAIVRVIGDAAGAARDWNCPVEEVKPTETGKPYFAALSTLDIGLVPLRDTPFNWSKSYLKALEFAAMGQAVVASPTPANRELAKTVPIILANSPAEWYNAMMSMVLDPDLRNQRGAENRESVLRQHTYESQAERWAVAWERAMRRRKALS